MDLPLYYRKNEVAREPTEEEIAALEASGWVTQRSKKGRRKRKTNEEKRDNEIDETLDERNKSDQELSTNKQGNKSKKATNKDGVSKTSEKGNTKKKVKPTPPSTTKVDVQEKK